MNYVRNLAGVLILMFLGACAVAQDPGDFLNPNAVPGQDLKGSATPVIMGKNAPEDLGPSQPKARLLSPSNRWHLNLRDTTDRVVELEMYQSNDVMFGKGTIAVDGDARNVTATGTVTGNKLNVDILTSDLSLFRLALTMNGKSLSGDYHIYSTSYVPGKGIAMGKIN